MKRILDSLEVLGAIETPEGPREVCASIDAAFDESAHRLIVRTGTFLRTIGIRSREERFQSNLLPPGESVSESVGEDEAGDLARDMFHRWVRKVRASLTSLHHASL